MNLKNKKIGKKQILEGIGLIAFVAFMIYVVVGGKAYRKDLEDNGCYTIGETIGFKYILKTGSGAKYIYTYQGKEYRDWQPAIDGTKYKGGRYLVKVLPTNPEHSDLDLTIPIEGDEIPSKFRPLCPDVE